MAVAALLSTLWVLDQYGPVQPSTLQGPVRQGTAKYGDGLYIEEGTTNLITNPSGTSATGWVSAGAGTSTFAVAAFASPVAASSLKHVTTNTGQSGPQTPTVTISASTQYTASIFIYVPSSSAQPGVMTFTDSTYGVISGGTMRDAAGNATNNAGFARDRWVRVYLTGTTSAGQTTGQIYMTSGNNGVTVYVAGAQIEQKAYVTSYCDGAQATAWNAAGNLLPAAAQSFEDGTTGGYVGAVNCTTSNTVSGFYPGAGGKATLVTPAGSGDTYVNGGAAARFAVTPLKTYSEGYWLTKVGGTGRSTQVNILWLDAAFSQVGQTNSAQKTLTASPQKIVASGVAPATAAFAVMQFVQIGAVAADTYAIDAGRAEEGTGFGAYFWTGTENGSTSTRTAAVVTHTTTGTAAAISGSAVTVCAWAKIGVSPASLTAPPLVVAYFSGATNTDDLYLLTSAAGSGPSAGSTNNGGSLGLSALAPGDTVFIAETISGTTRTAYASINGATIVSGSAGSTGTAITGTLSSVFVGCNNVGNRFADATVEQVLIFPAALSGADITAIATSLSEFAYKDASPVGGVFPVLASTSGITRGTTNGASSAGTGNYRGLRSVACSAEGITSTGANPDDDTATMKFTVPAGSGIGQGQLVTPNSPTGGNVYTVQKVFSPGGVYDELLVA